LSLLKCLKSKLIHSKHRLLPLLEPEMVLDQNTRQRKILIILGKFSKYLFQKNCDWKFLKFMLLVWINSANQKRQECFFLTFDQNFAKNWWRQKISNYIFCDWSQNICIWRKSLVIHSLMFLKKLIQISQSLGGGGLKVSLFMSWIF